VTPRYPAKIAFPSWVFYPHFHPRIGTKEA
jgi:hypothetical protein